MSSWASGGPAIGSSDINSCAIGANMARNFNHGLAALRELGEKRLRDVDDAAASAGTWLEGTVRTAQQQVAEYAPPASKRQRVTRGRSKSKQDKVRYTLYARSRATRQSCPKLVSMITNCLAQFVLTNQPHRLRLIAWNVALLRILTLCACADRLGLVSCCSC